MSAGCGVGEEGEVSECLLSLLPSRGEKPSHSDSSDSLESANLCLLAREGEGASTDTTSCSSSSCSSDTCCFLHFILRFWNQVFTCVSLSSRRPASSMRSGTLRYFFSANFVSSPSNCFSVNTVLSFLFLFMRCPSRCEEVSMPPAFLTISLMTATGAERRPCSVAACKSPSIPAKLKCVGV